MILGSLPRRYARALLDLATEENKVGEYGDSLEQLTAAFAGSVGSLEALADRFIPLRERLKAVGEIMDRLQVSESLRNFFLLVTEKGRMGILTDITREYGRMRDEVLGIIRVSVTTAQPMDPATLAGIEKILALRLKKTVRTEGRVDPELIGGVVVSIGHTRYDGSVRHELEKMREQMVLESIE